MNDASLPLVKRTRIAPVFKDRDGMRLTDRRRRAEGESGFASLEPAPSLPIRALKTKAPRILRHSAL
jgi:hypothetical protein